MPISDWILEPAIILLGCQAWPPKRRPGEGCPVCGDGVREGHDSTACGWCGSLSPRREAQVRAARTGLQTRGRTEAGEQSAKAELRKRDVALSERDRRRLWNGYKGGILSPLAEVSNRSRVGREWLKEIGQEPDWTLILDSRGNVVGRYEAESEVA